MLRRFFVDNFKTHINTTYNLAPVNLLLGMNNSGKTNLCQALRFVSLTATYPLATAATHSAHDEWTLANVYLNKPTIDLRVEADLIFQGEPCRFVYELSLRLADITQVKEFTGRLSVELEELTAVEGNRESVKLLVNRKGDVKLLDETGWSQSDRQYFEARTPTDSTMLARLYDVEHNPRSILFKNYIGKWLYYELDAQMLRKPEARILDTVLAPDGSNLASVLFNMKNANERLYRRLIEVTRHSIEPRIELLSFFSPAENTVLMLAEDSEGHRFGPWSMSSGTLRFLALAYVALNDHNLPAAGGSQLIIVEEPETGLYAGHLKDLFSLIGPGGKNGQFIFTSHSPYFIDLFDGMLEGVKLAQRGERSSTIVEPDVDKLQKRLEEMPLGEMHFREMMV